MPITVTIMQLWPKQPERFLDVGTNKHRLEQQQSLSSPW